MSYIVDLSHHQAPSKINYDVLAKQLDFAIIRTQYGSQTIDRHYKTHHAELRKRGVPTAAYAWVRGISVSDMEVEATDFYNRTKDLNPTFWFLDVEEKSMADMRAGVTAYIKKLRSLGAKKVGVYIAHHLYKSFNLDFSQADAVWIPHYGANNGQANSKPSFPCDIHQYTSVGRLDGYNGHLDLNNIISDKKLDFFTGNTENKKETPKVEVKGVSNDDYLHVVVAGDTLSGIASKYGLSVDYLVKLNNITNPHLIYTGQRIKLKGKVEETKQYYTIQPGDALSKIAKRFGTSVNQLAAWNNIKKVNVIYAGQKIRVK